MWVVAKKSEFSEWLEKAYITWQGKLGRRATVTEFAEYLGFPQPTVNNWLNSGKNPSNAHFHLLSYRLKDNSGYKLFGYPEPSLMELVLLKLRVNLPNMTPEQVETLNKLTDEFSAEVGEAEERDSQKRERKPRSKPV